MMKDKKISLVAACILLVLGLVLIFTLLPPGKSVKGQNEIAGAPSGQLQVNSALYVSRANNPTVYPKELKQEYPIFKYVEWGTVAEIPPGTDDIVEGEIYTVDTDSVLISIYNKVFTKHGTHSSEPVHWVTWAQHVGLGRPKPPMELGYIHYGNFQYIKGFGNQETGLGYAQRTLSKTEYAQQDNLYIPLAPGDIMRPSGHVVNSGGASVHLSTESYAIILSK